MPRVPVPKTRSDQTWSEARFWGFIRSALRQATLRWAPKRNAEIAARRPSQCKQNKRLKWQYQCSRCGRWYPRKEIELDHIEPVGQLRCADDLPGFVERLFCDSDGYEMLCKEVCHYNKTHGFE